MGVYYFIGNETKKQYLECEKDCGVKLYPMVHPDGNCVQTLLMERLLLGDWGGDSIRCFSDTYDLPWWGEFDADGEEIDTGWRDVTLQSRQNLEDFFNRGPDERATRKKLHLKFDEE